MKRLLFIIPIILLVLSSCIYNKVSEDTTLSKSVIKQLDKSNLDTVYVVKTDGYHYYFDSKKELIEQYHVDNGFMEIPVFLFFTAILIMFFIGRLFDKI